MTGRAKRWTEAEDNAILVLFADGPVAGNLVRVLGHKLGRTYLAVKRRALKLGCDGIDQHPYIGIGTFARETGYNRTRILIAIERLGITLREYGHYRNGTPRVRAIPKTRIPEILAECQKAPDGGLLSASRHGEWGRRGRNHMNPAACLRCYSNDKPHYSKGYCRTCYGRQWREGKEASP